MVRALVLAAAVCVGLSGCAVDGGLVDPDSASSQVDRAAAARAEAIEGASAATQSTMLAFYRSVCSLQTRYRAELKAAEREAGALTPAQYRDTAAMILGGRAAAADGARDTAGRLPIPDLYPDEWRSAQGELVGLFERLGQADRARAGEMGGVDIADTDRLRGVARDLLAASAQQIENENPRIRVVAQRLPASKQVRRDAGELSECRTPS
ncbi:hypothetical protein [Nocardia canadensis]|uniref:hypothetical protein n=1 Tax=Nocardia canadensis TaxID=3065238 RepID=UPI002930741E|nr:hypothetical protein [Nocardia canadensis]